MRNKLIAILMCVVLGIMMAGCGSDDSDSKSEDNAPEIDKDFSIAMTDNYTFTDPEDLDFNQRYVLVGDESCKLLSDMKNFGYTATNVYQIVYAKDGVAAGEYDYFVTPDEASATELAEFYSSQGQNITQEGNILYASVDGDTLQANITLYASSGNSMSEETVEAYVEMMKNFNGLMDY